MLGRALITQVCHYNFLICLFSDNLIIKYIKTELPVDLKWPVDKENYQNFLKIFLYSMYKGFFLNLGTFS